MEIIRGEYDFHIHTKHSDGEFTVREIIDQLLNYGCKGFSITDHDNIDGNQEAINYIKEKNIDIDYVTGVEFSCKDENTFVKSHILGYNIDFNHDAIKTLINKMQEMRITKMNYLFEHLKEKFDIEISEEHKNFIFSKEGTIGKPILVKILVENNYFEKIEKELNRKLDIEEIYKVYLKLDKSKIAETNLSTKDVISAINIAGGIPILAHASIEKQDYPEIDIEEHVKNLISYGLKGIELYNECISEEDRIQFKEFAEKYNLITSGGSDYHGESIKEIAHVMSGIDNNCVIHENDITLLKFVK
ncbi:MAG: PHP domain-containing protein [Clostridia bacterium]|nr:PHP domain-containing protein [Clostridia bacterium]